MVRVSFFKESSIARRSFLSTGRNASKQNRLVERPESVRAVTQAQAPGKEVTVKPASYACLTSSSPGSDIPGVPASVTSAISVPFVIFSTRYFDLTVLSYFLCLRRQ